MSEDHDQPGAELRCGKLHAADLGRRNNVAGHANDEQLAKALVEHDLCGDPRVGASKDDRERLLVSHELVGASTVGRRLAAANAGNEAAVAVDEAFKSFPGWNRHCASLLYGQSGSTRLRPLEHHATVG